MQQSRASVSVDRQLKTKYDGYYDGQSEWRRTCAIDKVKNIQALAHGEHFQDVIEVGAGEGGVLSRLDEIGFADNLFGLEISESGLAAIKARNLPRVREVGSFDGYKAPYEDDRFDLAIATHVLEHVEHERLFLRELRRISRHVFIEVPLEDTWRVATAINNDIGHINFYRRETLLSLLDSVGLDVVRARVFDISWAASRYLNSPVKGLARYLVRRTMLRTAPNIAQRFLTYHFAVLARRR